MKGKYQETKDALHGMKRTDAIRILHDADLTAREREILIDHELERKTSIKELAEKYCVEERSILRTKQIALKKLQKEFM